VADLPPKYRPAALLAQLNLDAIADELPPIAEAEEAEEAAGIDDSSVIAMLTEQDSNETVVQLPAEGLDLRDHLFSIERGLIQQALSRSGGTVAHAARLLKLRRTTLVEKLRKFQMLNEAAASEV
jgi:sigma-54 specific flagellar transcriptional regulator A